MDMHTEDLAARHVADLVKTGNGDAVGNALASDFLDLSKNGQNTRDFLNKVQADNASDLKTSALLPGLEIDASPSGDVRVSITGPAELLSKDWRNNQEERIANPWPSKEEVFADIYSGEGKLINNPPGATKVGGNETAIAEKGSFVEADDHSHVIGRSQSLVDAHDHSSVAAEYGAVVSSRDKSSVWAESGSLTAAWDSSYVIANDGAKVEAEFDSHVVANKGASVDADDHAQVQAKPGSHVTKSGNAIITNVAS